MNDSLTYSILTEADLWNLIISYQSCVFYTVSGLPFTYTIKTSRNGQLTRELLIDRREQSKTLTWSSIRVAFERVVANKEAGMGCCYAKPKAIGDIRGISYIYPLFWKLGIIEVPEAAARKMSDGGFPPTTETNKLLPPNALRI